MGVYSGEPKASQCKRHIDRTRICYRTCEKKQQIGCKVFLCDSVIGHAFQNIIGSTGEREIERARDNSRTVYNFPSLVNREYGERSFSFSEN